MELTKIQISNYRSIKRLDLYLFPRCKGFIGINESGKTNILSAISHLSKTVEIKTEDIREPMPDEPPVEDSHIWFVFRLNNSERKTLLEKVSEKVLAKNTVSTLISENGNKLSLKSFCEKKEEGLFVVNIKTKYKGPSYWGIHSGAYEVNEIWKKPSKGCPDDFAVETNGGGKAILKNYKLVNHDDFADIPESYLENIDAKYINVLVGEEISNIVRPNVPDCVYWSYTEENLLPGLISTASFIENPDICKPLKHMFELSGHFNIKKAITEAKEKPNGMRNLLKRVSENSTKHLHSIWKEYKIIKFHLAENGEHIEAGIEDKFNIYSAARRSDGFKRFLTFLLLISARQRTNQLENTLIVIDEPDIGLHPSGARYLREELKNLSENNYVFFSTHSIFMIDKENIDHHLIVKKSDEITTIEEINESNIVDEEVIYNALGYSIYDNLSKNNIVFEGWRDKRLFMVATKQPKKNSKKVKEFVSKIGLCHAKGVKDISRVTGILEMANRDCLIVSDADDVAKEQKKKYEGIGKWMTYVDLDAKSTAITGEDYVKYDVFLPVLRILRKKYPQLPEIPEEDLKSNGRAAKIKDWLRQGNIEGDELRLRMDEIKETIFSKLKPSQIEDDYYNLVNGIMGSVKV